MGGKFNPFASKQEEVLRRHLVPTPAKARKLLAKYERKRPCVWVEIPDLESPDAQRQLEALDGSVTAVVFLTGTPALLLPDPLPPILDQLIRRFWNEFKKVHLIQLGEAEADEDDD